MRNLILHGNLFIFIGTLFIWKIWDRTLCVFPTIRGNAAVSIFESWHQGENASSSLHIPLHLLLSSSPPPTPPYPLRHSPTKLTPPTYGIERDDDRPMNRVCLCVIYGES